MKNMRKIIFSGDSNLPHAHLALLALTTLAVAALGGCDYTTPLVTKPEIEIDQSLVGLWQSTKPGGPADKLLVLPLNPREYLVSYPAGKDDAMFGRGCLWRGAGLTLVQLDWFGTARAVLPEDRRTFQFAAYTVAGGQLSVRLLNADVVKNDVQTPEELAKAIAAHQDDEALFREALLFKKIKR